MAQQHSRTPGLKAALYARISTSLHYARQDPETQLLPLREFCARRGWTIVAVYVDDLSAVKRRPQYEQMLQDARRGMFDIVVVVRLDRIFRSVEEFVSTVRQFDHWNVRFLCVDQPIDTDQGDPSGRLLMTIIAAVAEFERSLISERVRAGIQRVRAQGRKWGGSRPKRIDLARARGLIREGWSLARTAQALGVNRNLLSKRLREPTLAEVFANEEKK